MITNWSHGDQKVRFRIPVGVAYGSDLAKVKEALLEVARNHPATLSDPEPKVFFESFGDSALNLELVVWSAEMSFRPRSSAGILTLPSIRPSANAVSSCLFRSVTFTSVPAVCLSDALDRGAAMKMTSSRGQLDERLRPTHALYPRTSPSANAVVEVFRPLSETPEKVRLTGPLDCFDLK
jgi:Mechanosensitive ion channel